MGWLHFGCTCELLVAVLCCKLRSGTERHPLLPPHPHCRLHACPLQISLMPQSAEPKTLGDYFPALKLGGKKR